MHELVRSTSEGGGLRPRALTLTPTQTRTTTQKTQPNNAQHQNNAQQRTITTINVTATTPLPTPPCGSFPACVGDKCLVAVDVAYPKGGAALGLGPPFPLVVWAGGFTVGAGAYAGTAARLASWG